MIGGRNLKKKLSQDPLSLGGFAFVSELMVMTKSYKEISTYYSVLSSFLVIICPFPTFLYDYMVKFTFE
jgi:hypothetical protein